MDIFSLHMNLNITCIPHPLWTIPMIMCIDINAAVNPIEL